MTSAHAASGLAASTLAATGSDIAPWLIGAGIVIVLGALAFIIGQVMRSRGGATPPMDAAAGPAAAAAESDELSSPPAGEQGTDPISPDDPR
jgi:hypothetical protein